MASFISERNCVKIWRCLLDREIPLSWKDTEKSCQAKKGGMKTQFEKKKNSKVGRVYYSDQI